jgi:ABC-2 type transport system ATP-binding protein
MSDRAIVEVEEFTKVYGRYAAVDKASFELRRGETLALLGPNGAGKTTSLECIEGLRRPDGGRIRVFGLDPSREGRRLCGRMGVQLQAQGLPSAMTAREALAFFARYRGFEPDYSVALRLGLEPKLGSAVSDLSTGQQRRLALALAAAHDPELLVLDEPTAGLDVETRDELHALMAELKARKGTTILLATHDMAEAEKLADRALVMVGGAIVAEGSPRELTAGGSGRTRIAVSTEGSSLIRLRQEIAEAERMPDEDAYAVFLSKSPGKSLRHLLARLEAAGDEVVDLRVERPTLEERFLEIVQRREA